MVRVLTIEYDCDDIDIFLNKLLAKRVSMQRYVLGVMLGMMTLGACAEGDVKADSAAVPAAQPLPEGVTTEKNLLKQEIITQSKRPALFRPSENMPEIVNEDLLRGMTESKKNPGNVSQFIGYMPKVKVLPCEKGCEGSDYDRAVKAFIKGYRGQWKDHIKERGEMIVQVRRYTTAPFYMRGLPYGTDAFGVSFILEGKLVSFGQQSLIGGSTTSDELANRLGARLATELLFSLGVGTRPAFLTPVSEEGLEGTLHAATNAMTAINGAFGSDDVRSRIEPATEANANLLPAIDGIKPGEIAPITGMHYVNSLAAF
jgi:hypothetical protein